MVDRIRVFVADDHPVYRYGLRALLNAEPSMEFAGEAETGLDAIRMVGELCPHVVLMDINMPGLDGLEATRQISARHPNTGILMLTMQEDEESLFTAMRAGARGYIVKGADTAEIVRSIKSVAEGGVVFGVSVAQKVVDYFAEGPASAVAADRPFPELTAREREVLDLVAAGLTNAAIADRLFLSPKTVRNHISTIFSKLQVQDRGEAIVRARNAGLG